MEELKFKDAISNVLNLASPWFVDHVKLNKKVLVLDVFISFSGGSEFNCPVCLETCKVHDSVLKRVRHLDFLEYRCYLNYKVPRTKCITHGVKTYDKLPLTRTGSHYSFFLNKK